MPVWSIIAVLLFAILGVFALKAFLEIRVQQLKTRETYRHALYKRVKKLVRNDEISDELADFLVKAVENVQSTQFVRRYVSYLLRRRGNKAIPGEASSRIEEIHALSDRTRDRVYECIALFAIAVTYNNWILGVFVRRVVLTGLDKSKNSHPEVNTHELGRLDSITASAETGWHGPLAPV